MNQKEKWVLASILGSIFLLVTSDIVGDFREGVEIWHVLLEGGIGVISLFGVFYTLRDSFQVRKKLSNYREEAEKWRSEYKKYLEGLSGAIDAQLMKWDLTTAEREVAFLLLKGLSLKEIATIRNTTEKTARAQSMAIYSKSGLTSRSELSAFFLEDLLVPQQQMEKL